VEGAREELYRELSGDFQDIRARIATLRRELLDMYYLVSPRGGDQERGDRFR
jgi:hypothetical protein